MQLVEEKKSRLIRSEAALSFVSWSGKPPVVRLCCGRNGLP
jgi:hypothetical protein